MLVQKPASVGFCCRSMLVFPTGFSFNRHFVNKSHQLHLNDFCLFCEPKQHISADLANRRFVYTSGTYRATSESFRVVFSLHLMNLSPIFTLLFFRSVLISSTASSERSGSLDAKCSTVFPSRSLTVPVCHVAPSRKRTARFKEINLWNKQHAAAQNHNWSEL